MTDPKFEIPNEVREFAERSVEQARKAFEGFVSAAVKATATVEDTAHKAQGGAKQLGAGILVATSQNVNSALDLVDKLVKAKGPQEALALQSEYLKTQLQTLQGQAKMLGAMVHEQTSAGSK